MFQGQTNPCVTATPSHEAKNTAARQAQSTMYLRRRRRGGTFGSKGARKDCQSACTATHPRHPSSRGQQAPVHDGRRWQTGTGKRTEVHEATCSKIWAPHRTEKEGIPSHDAGLAWKIASSSLQVYSLSERSMSSGSWAQDVCATHTSSARAHGEETDWQDRALQSVNSSVSKSGWQSTHHLIVGHLLHNSVGNVRLSARGVVVAGRCKSNDRGKGKKAHFFFLAERKRKERKGKARQR